MFFKKVVECRVEEHFCFQSRIQRPFAKAIVAYFTYLYVVETQQRKRTKTLEALKSAFGGRNSRQSIQQNVEPSVQYINILAFSAFFFCIVPYVTPDPWYITGFTEGDGGSYVTISRRLIVHNFNFSAAQEEILLMVRNDFGFGKIYSIDVTKYRKKDSRPFWRLSITKNQDLYSLGRNHFDFFPMFCSKQKHYLAVDKVVKATREGLSSEAREALFHEILEVNLEGKRRTRRTYY